MPPDAKAQQVVAYAEQDCGSLIRCALAAGGSAEVRMAGRRFVWRLAMARLAASRRCWTAARTLTLLISVATRR